MMKFSLKNILFIGLLLASAFANAQFNTLIKATPPNKEPIAEQTIEQEPKEKEKKKLFGLFGNEKKEMQKIIDSLKNVLDTNKVKFDRTKIIDSLETIYIKRLSDAIKTKEKTEKRKNIPKISMPLRGNLHLTSDYGMRVHPIQNQWKMHSGIDLRANNQFVYAVLDGVVSEIGYENKGGLYIKVKHQNGYETAYLHLSEIYYKKDDEVKAGYIIARSGNTGSSTAPHLHFAVKENNKYINPLYFLRDLVEINNL